MPDTRIRDKTIREIALAIWFIRTGREYSEPPEGRGGPLDPRGSAYKEAVVAMETMQRLGWHHG